MRDRTTIHREIDQAQSHLTETLSSLKAAVRRELDPQRNAHRAVELGERKLKELASRALSELRALGSELGRTARTEGWRTAFIDLVDHVRAAIRDLRHA